MGLTHCHAQNFLRDEFSKVLKVMLTAEAYSINNGTRYMFNVVACCVRVLACVREDQHGDSQFAAEKQGLTSAVA